MRTMCCLDLLFKMTLLYPRFEAKNQSAVGVLFVFVVGSNDQCSFSLFLKC